MPDVLPDRVGGKVGEHGWWKAAVRLDRIPDTEEVNWALALPMGRPEALRLGFARAHRLEQPPGPLEPSREVGVGPRGQAASVDESGERPERERPSAETEGENPIPLVVQG